MPPIKAAAGPSDSRQTPSSQAQPGGSGSKAAGAEASASSGLVTSDNRRGTSTVAGKIPWKSRNLSMFCVSNVREVIATVTTMSQR